MSTTLISNAEIFRAGDYGEKGKYSLEDLQAMAADYDPTYHNAPVVPDHKEDGPSYGWVNALRVKGNVLCADATIDSDFAAKIKERQWPSRSIELYKSFERTKRPHLRHLSFLGAGIPAVKGLGPIQFSDDSECVTIDFEEFAGVTKTEGGESYPAAAYAYVPDPNDSNRWKIRLWESPTAKVTKAQLGRAVKAVEGITEESTIAVKAKIRAAYRSLGITDSAIPEHLFSEGIARSIDVGFAAMPAMTDVQFAEAGKKGEYPIIIIRAGVNEARTFDYPKVVLERDHKVYDGAKMFVDHQTAAEERERPERSVRKWVGSVRRPFVVEGGSIHATAAVFDREMRQRLESLREAGLLSEMGISHITVVEGEKFSDDARKPIRVIRLHRCKSVDFVTYAGTGGRCEQFADADRRADDVDLLTDEEIRVRRPELFVATESEPKETENMAEIETLKEKIAELESQNIKFAEKEKLAARQARIAETGQKIQAALAAEKDLPAATVARLAERFKDSETIDRFAEAVKAEREYVAALAKSGTVKGLGMTEAPTQTEQAAEGRKQLEERFYELNIASGKIPEEARKLAVCAAAGRDA